MTQYYPSTVRYVFDPIKGLIQEIAETSTVTFASGTIIEVSGVFAYVPEDPSKWSTVPTNLIQAVDYLAAGSGSGGGGGGGGTPGGSNGDIQYRVDGTTFGGVNKLTFVGGNLVGTGSFNGVFSGSLTKLENGSDYLVAGTNISLTTGSNGSVTIDGAGSIGGTIAANEVAFGIGGDAIAGSPSFTWNELGDSALRVYNNAATTNIKITAEPYMYVESSDSMNINVANFAGALGLQAGGVDLVLIGGDDGGGEKYVQTQTDVRLETQGRLTVKPATDSNVALQVKTSFDVPVLTVDTNNEIIDLAGLGLTLNGAAGNSGDVLTSSGPGVPPGWASTVSNAVSSSYADFALSASYATNAEFSWEQTKFVAKNGNDATADGTLNKPFLTISGAMASINDASPSKRYIINVNPGAYTETGIFELKANVFINGFDRNTVRITPTSFALNSDFSGSSAIDNRSGFSNCTLIGDCNFDWSAVFSPAGKLYFQNCSFNNNVTLTGYNNSIAQTVTSNCLFFGSYTISGINAGTHQGNIHYGAVNLNQHPSLPTILNANGGGAGSTTVTTTVNNFGRRCACFFYSFWAGSLTIDGPSSYVDATQSSLDTAGPTTLNGGTFVSIGTVVNSTLSNLTNPTSINANLVPDTTNNRYNGDFGKQWLFNFAYVYGSTGTEMYFITMPNTFGSSDTGRDIWLLPDGYGLDTNVNGGNIILETAATSGTGSRGAIILNARHVDVSGSLIRNLATPITGSDAATAKYADVFPTGSTGSRPTGPVTGQRFFDITIGLPIWWNGTNWINAAGTIV